MYYPCYFRIRVFEPNLDKIWYTINGGNTNVTLSRTSGYLNSEVWEYQSDGPVTIQFFAQDKAGNIGSAAVIVIMKSVERTPPSIKAYDLYIILSLIGIVNFLVIEKLRKRFKNLN